MNKLAKVLTLGVLSSVALGACAQSDEGDALGPNEAQLRVAAMVDVSSGVSGIHYTISACGGEVVSDVVRGLEDQLIPGNLSSLQGNPLDENSEHMFADLFQVLPAGCYSVVAQPVNEDGSASEICAPAHDPEVMISEGETTEIFLLSQCKSTDPGAIDIIAALNHEPELIDVRFDDSKFVCGSPGVVCASAVDEDNDPLRYVFSAGEGCEVGEQSEADGYICVPVTCHAPGRTELSVSVYDLAWKDGVEITIEDWLAEAGYPSESHANLNFWAYFDGISVYPDVDGDSFGDADATATLVCDEVPEGTSTDNTDCDDSLGEVNPDAEEVCGNGIDDNCNDEIDEDCDPDVGDMTCEGGMACGEYDPGECDDCGPNGVCVATAEGGSTCHRDISCGGLPSCVTSADCGESAACIIDTCCGAPVCIPDTHLGWGAAACYEVARSGDAASGASTTSAL